MTSAANSFRSVALEWIDKRALGMVGCPAPADTRRWQLPKPMVGWVSFEQREEHNPTKGRAIPDAVRNSPPPSLGYAALTQPTRESGFQHWTVPFDTDPDYPKALADAVTAIHGDAGGSGYLPPG